MLKSKQFRHFGVEVLDPTTGEKSPKGHLTEAEAAVKSPNTPPLKEHSKESKDSKEAKMAELEGQNRELTDTCQRIQAEFENFKKRSAKEKEWIQDHEKARVLNRFLPVLESLEQAQKHAKAEEKKGLDALHRLFWKELEAEGLRRMVVLKKPFDPQIADCVLQGFEPNQPDGIVLEELSAGYWMGPVVLRHAKVRVNAIPSASNAENDALAAVPKNEKKTGEIKS